MEAPSPLKNGTGEADGAWLFAIVGAGATVENSGTMSKEEAGLGDVAKFDAGAPETDTTRAAKVKIREIDEVIVGWKHSQEIGLR